MKKFRSNKLAILLFILPTLAVFLAFDFIPIVQVFAYSFTEWNGLTTPVFNGLKNYTDLFNDRVFATSNRNQLIFAAIITVYQITFATIFAITLSNQRMKGRKFLRIAYFVPVILSITVVCQLWSAILSGDGLLNKLFEVFG
ncbi:MAG: sugar ABC transporter permease, partial [Lachnospiraceae bacterium]|nr:sugar ABC transporter permease [Lachnospiraceae bacterium]